MGEICKDPRNETAAASPAVESSLNIVCFLVRAEGAARTVRLIQYAFEKLAAESAKSDINTAAKYLKAADILDEPHEKIRNEIRL